MHEEITARRSLSELTASFEAFEVLRGMVLLFNREHRYYPYSGWVTAALLDYEPDGTTILATTSDKSGMITLKLTRSELEEALRACDAFIGQTPETSFLLARDE